MSPIVRREEAKEGGFAQVREALTAFEGDVVSAEFGQWGGKLLDDEGNPLPPREFLEVVCTNVVPTEVTEELSMDISEKWTFRVNCSEYKGSFWVDKFLESADRFKLLIPDELIGKRLGFRKVTLEARDPKYNSTNYVIDKVIKKGVAPKVVTKTTIAAKPTISSTLAVEAEEVPTEDDPMALAMELAVGKTEQQFRSAVSLHPKFVGSPLLPMAKAGLVTASLVKEGKLVEIQQGTKIIYQKPG